MTSTDPFPRRSPRAVRVGVGVTIGVLVAATVAGQADGNAPLLWLDITAGVVALAIVPVLMRWPVPGALVLAAVAVCSAAATPPATVGTLLVAQRRPLAVAVVSGSSARRPTATRCRRWSTRTRRTWC